MGIRQDLFGIIDILVLHPFRGVLGIQVTGQDFSGHNKKILASKYGKEWLRVPGTALELWAWQKKKGVYVLKLKRYTLDDF